ncbi:MAG TPA: DUF6603 domain-containing protein [Ornithinibacter sp.]|nr:DUF6603 domain-containing protein [Ornithinibacter sp.]
MADAAAAVPLDGAIAAFLTRVLDDLVRQVADESAIRRSLAELGVEGPDAGQVVAFLASAAGDITAVRSAVPALVTELGRPDPDLLSLVGPLQGLFETVTTVAGSAPTLSIPTLPDAGTIVETLLAGSVERTLRTRHPAAWSLGRALQLVGPELPLSEVLSGVLDSPLGFVWSRFNHLRRHLDITIAGILTGPRTVSFVTVPVSPADRVSDQVRARVPDADVVLQRITLRLAADAYEEPHPLTFEVLGHDPGNGGLPEFAAVVLMTDAVAAPLHLSDVVTIDLDPLESPFGVAATGFGEVVTITDGSPSIELGSSVSRGFTFGQPGGIRLVLDGPVLEPHISTSGWGLRAGMETLELTVPADVAGPVLAVLLPRDGIRLRGKLLVAVDEHGIHLEGGVGLRTTWPDTIRLPGLLVRDLTTEVSTAGAALGIRAAGTVTVELGPLTLTIAGLGADQSIEVRPDGDGNLGLVHLGDLTLAPLTGLGVSLDAGIVKGGGFLRIEPTGVSGALELALTLGSVEIAIRAVGVLESVEGRLSFVVVMSVEFTPAIEIFLGLTLNAVGGVFGVNRTVDTDGLTAMVRTGRMTDVMFPRDLASRAVEVIAAVKQVFPARTGQTVVGPMLRLGWGRPVSFVTVSVGVVLTFPDPTLVAVIGSFRIALPEPDLPVIDIRADFSGTIDLTTGEVSFDASLTSSRIATFDVSGDIALRAGPAGFLFTAGGFHPAFTPPAGLGQVRRLAISMAPAAILSIRAEAYVALTASTVQFGGALFVVADLGPIAVRGHLGLDVLIRTQPTLSFVAEMRGQFRLSVGGEDILTADLSVLLEGPGRWHARAHASISFLFFSVSGTLELSWGEAAGPALGAPVSVAAEVRAALVADHVWAHVIPAEDGGLVTLREGAAALHPLGRLRLTQTVAPLAVALQHFGTAAVADAGPVQVSVTADLAVPEPTQELFAAAQFFELSDDEKLSKPAFVPHLAGYTLRGDAWSPLSDAVVAEVVYEEGSGGRRRPRGSRLFGGVEESFLGWSVLGAAGRAHGERVVPAGPRPGIRVNPVAYAAVDAATGTVAGGAGTGLEMAFAASMRSTADTVVMADYEIAGLVP